MCWPVRGHDLKFIVKPFDIHLYGPEREGQRA
jgi:hypothetical protein